MVMLRTLTPEIRVRVPSSPRNQSKGVVMELWQWFAAGCVIGFIIEFAFSPVKVTIRTIKRAKRNKDRIKPLGPLE